MSYDTCNSIVGEKQASASPLAVHGLGVWRLLRPSWRASLLSKECAKKKRTPDHELGRGQSRAGFWVDQNTSWHYQNTGWQALDQTRAGNERRHSFLTASALADTGAASASAGTQARTRAGTLTRSRAGSGLGVGGHTIRKRRHAGNVGLGVGGLARSRAGYGLGVGGHNIINQNTSW